MPEGGGIEKVKLSYHSLMCASGQSEGFDRPRRIWSTLNRIKPTNVATPHTDGFTESERTNGKRQKPFQDRRHGTNAHRGTQGKNGESEIAY